MENLLPSCTVLMDTFGDFSLLFFVAVWLYWKMSFYLRVDTGQDYSVNDASCGTCHFGKCGMTGQCECAPGYSGSQCEIRKYQVSNFVSQHSL